MQGLSRDLATPGDPWPFDTQDFGGNGEVDALANAHDAFFWSVIANRVDLIVSFETDPANPPGIATYYETPGPPPPVVRAPQYLQRDLSNQPAILPNMSDIDDVDGIEYWGPYHDGVAPLSGWDANMYSLAGDAATGTSVYYFPGPAGPRRAYVPHAAIVAAVTALGYAGAAPDVDLDGLMVNDNGDYIWNLDDAILFSIRAVAGSGWHGGEIVVLRNGFAPAFLFHGGHLWDSTVPNLPSAYFAIPTNEVDAIEAAPVKGQEFGCCKIMPTGRTLETEEGCADWAGKFFGDGSVCPGGRQGEGIVGIPAVSEWGLIVLALIVFTVGTVALGRKRRPATT